MGQPYSSYSLRLRLVITIGSLMDALPSCLSLIVHLLLLLMLIHTQRCHTTTTTTASAVPALPPRLGG
jgi:hypothetical protein